VLSNIARPIDEKPYQYELMAADGPAEVSPLPTRAPPTRR